METFTLPFVERLLLAVEACMMRAEQRDGYLSDDDILDIALRFTTDEWRTTDDIDPFDGELPDHDLLVDTLMKITVGGC